MEPTPPPSDPNPRVKSESEPRNSTYAAVVIGNRKLALIRTAGRGQQATTQGVASSSLMVAQIMGS